MTILFRLNFGICFFEGYFMNQTMLEMYLSILRGLQITADCADEASVAVNRGYLVVRYEALNDEFLVKNRRVVAARYNLDDCSIIYMPEATYYARHPAFTRHVSDRYYDKSITLVVLACPLSAVAMQCACVLSGVDVQCVSVSTISSARLLVTTDRAVLYDKSLPDDIISVLNGQPLRFGRQSCLDYLSGLGSIKHATQYRDKPKKHVEAPDYVKFAKDLPLSIYTIGDLHRLYVEQCRVDITKAAFALAVSDYVLKRRISVYVPAVPWISEGKMQHTVYVAVRQPDYWVQKNQDDWISESKRISL